VAAERGVTVNRHSVVALAAAALCSVLLSGVSPASAGVRAASGAGAVLAGTWGSAEEVPGIAALNRGGSAEISSVSCASAGNCSGGGWYTDRAGHQQAFVAGEVSGTWRTARELRDTAALNKGGNAAVNSVSCASAGNCSAGGFYRNKRGRAQAFIADEVNGTWGPAMEVPGTAALNVGGRAQVSSVSCASAGNCSAAGGYGLKANGVSRQPFVVDEVNGTWGTAVELPGIEAIDRLAPAAISSVSCASAGNCSVGGSATSGVQFHQAFVADEVNGTWQNAEIVPRSPRLNQGRNAGVSSMSCASAGNCSAEGIYADSPAHYQAFVAGEVNGTWGKAEEVPGTAALNTAGGAVAGSVSCASAGNCSAGGIYTNSSGPQAFVADEVNGTWRFAKEVPGTAALNAGEYAAITSVSCASAGKCSAGGSYTDSPGHQQAFVVSQVDGTWHKAIEAPGTAALNQGGNAAINTVSCASAGNCSAGGSYTDSSGHQQAFVVRET